MGFDIYCRFHWDRGCRFVDFFMSAYRVYGSDAQTLQFWKKREEAAHRLKST